MDKCPDFKGLRPLPPPKGRAPLDSLYLLKKEKGSPEGLAPLAGLRAEPLLLFIDESLKIERWRFFKGYTHGITEHE